MNVSMYGCVCRVVIGGDTYCVRVCSFHSGRSVEGRVYVCR